MRISLKLLFLHFIVLSSAAFFTITAQSPRSCPIPPPSPYRHNALIATRFDRATGEMRTVLEHPSAVETSGRGMLYLAASFAHSGWSAPPSIELTFVSVSSATHYHDSHALTVFTDDNSTQLAPPRYMTSTRDGRTYEAVQTTLPFSNLLEITTAQAVRVRIGASEFALTDNHLEALRELTSLMRPASRDAGNPLDLPNDVRSGK